MSGAGSYGPGVGPGTGVEFAGQVYCTLCCCPVDADAPRSSPDRMIRLVENDLRAHWRCASLRGLATKAATS